MKIVAGLTFALLATLLVSCSGTTEGNSDAAVNDIRKEMPEPKHEALPVDETAKSPGDLGAHKGGK